MRGYRFPFVGTKPGVSLKMGEVGEYACVFECSISSIFLFIVLCTLSIYSLYLVHSII